MAKRAGKEATQLSPNTLPSPAHTAGGLGRTRLLNSRAGGYSERFSVTQAPLAQHSKTKVGGVSHACSLVVWVLPIAPATPRSAIVLLPMGPNHFHLFHQTTCFCRLHLQTHLPPSPLTTATTVCCSAPSSSPRSMRAKRHSVHLDHLESSTEAVAGHSSTTSVTLHTCQAGRGFCVCVWKR